MFKKILVPVDLTDRHQQALDAACQLAAHSAGEVTLLHVIEVIPGLSMDEEKDFYKRLERIARKHLEPLNTRLKERGVSSQSEIRYGVRAQEVVKYAQEVRSDLIVLTAPRFDPDNLMAGWGSLSHKLSLVSPCPVLLVK
jgi:nucleotide-binding universal stress UspA family protein